MILKITVIIKTMIMIVIMIIIILIMIMTIIKGSLDEKLPSYEVLKMRENRCLKNRCQERIDSKRE